MMGIGLTGFLYLGLAEPLYGDDLDGPLSQQRWLRFHAPGAEHAPRSQAVAFLRRR